MLRSSLAIKIGAAALVAFGVTGGGVALAAQALEPDQPSATVDDEQNQVGEEGQSGELEEANEAGDEGQAGETEQANDVDDQTQEGTTTS